MSRADHNLICFLLILVAICMVAIAGTPRMPPLTSDCPSVSQHAPNVAIQAADRIDAKLDMLLSRGMH